jgi:hypothetical protein
MKGYLVPVHQVLDLPPGEENIREAGVFGNQEAVSVPVGLEPADDDVSPRRKAVVATVEFHDLPFVHQTAKNLAQFLPPGRIQVESLSDIGQSEGLALASPNDA